MRTRSRPGVLVGVAVSVAYTLAYLVAIGDINPRSGIDFGLDWTAGSLDVLWQRRFGVRFEGVAIVDLPGVTWLLAPLNLTIGAGLGALVGINAILGYAAYRRRPCGVGGTTATLATVPALVSGAACCAPVTLLVIGVPATASVLGLFSVLTLFQWLVPIAVFMLIASALFLYRRST